MSLLALSGLLPQPVTSAQNGGGSKISGLLALQVQAKLRAKEAVPLAEGQFNILEAFQAQSGETLQINQQRIFLYSAEKLNQLQIQELETMGLTVYPDSWIPPVGNHPNGFTLSDMPLDSLNELAGKGYVVRLDTAERILKPQNDLSNLTMNADDVWASGWNGTGVTVAVLDSGLDLTHSDIPTPVAIKDYSNYPILDDTIGNTVTGHGTHVTGSVLGRAANTPGSTYNGTAPGANLVFLKIGNDTTGGATTAAIVAAMQAAVDTYSADIITMSYGGWDTYHDGSSQEAQAVDYAVSQGAAVFISAGNEGNDAQHYSGTVAGSSTTGNIQINVSGAGVGDTGLWFNMVWYDGITTSNVLSAQLYNVAQNTISTYNDTQNDSTRGTEARQFWYGTSGGPFAVSPGSATYFVRVTNASTSTQDFHIYVWYAGAGSVTFQNPDTAYTLSSPADADSAMAIGSYTTRKYWWNYANAGTYSFSSGETVNQISTFSSRGPRVDEGSNKVNVVAPGSATISARDNDVYAWPSGANALYIDNDGPNEDSAIKNDGNGPADYYVMQGTSMASPHAAGAAALILNKNPTWTAAQVRHAMEANATDKGTAGFDNTYGWGLVDALAAANSSLATTASFSDAAHSTPSDNFDDFGTEHTVYINATGLHANYSYRVTYYDGSNAKRATDDVVSGTSGNVSSQHTFLAGTDIAGTWHAVISEPFFTPPNSYNGTWAYTITSDDFNVEDAAIPEFPTSIAVIMILSLCLAVYLLMRRRTTESRSTS